jgi:hypothetical protein
MPIEYENDRVVFRDRVSVEEADTLLQWLQDHADATVDLGPCLQMHTANLQVLLVARRAIVAWPKDPLFQAWLTSTLDVPSEA